MQTTVETYLREHGTPYEPQPHARAVTAQDLAATLHITGYELAKPVVLNVDGALWLALVAAPARIDVEKVAQALGARSVRLAREDEFADRFPGCEIGAEPPLGHLFGLPIIVDDYLATNEFIVCRAGTHDEAMKVRFSDFSKLETLKKASIAEQPSHPPRWAQRWGAEGAEDEQPYGG